MKTKLIVAAGLAALAIPVVAQTMSDRTMRPGAEAMTRADAEARIRDRFARADTDRDGAVTVAELREGRVAKRAERRAKRFDRLDADSNGAISRAEFDAAGGNREGRGGGMRQRRAMRGAAMAGGLFARADADRDGRITLAEVMTPAMARFDRADVNRDGTVTPGERRDARMKMREEWRAKRG